MKLFYVHICKPFRARWASSVPKLHLEMLTGCCNMRECTKLCTLGHFIPFNTPLALLLPAVYKHSAIHTKCMRIITICINTCLHSCKVIRRDSWLRAGIPMGTCAGFRVGQHSNCKFVQNVLAAKAFVSWITVIQLTKAFEVRTHWYSYTTHWFLVTTS